MKLFPLAQETLVLPVGQKLAQNRFISYSFRDIFNVLLPAKNQISR